MSFHAVRQVLDRSRSKGLDRLILITIADHLSRDITDRHGLHIAWPTIDRIMKSSGLARATVRKHVKNLIEMGELIVTHNYDHEAKGQIVPTQYGAGPRRNIYRIKLPPKVEK